jgi:hypothetical protein
MKPVQTISLLLNLVLAASLIVVLANRRKESAVTAPRPITETMPSAQAVAVPAPAILTKQPSRPFRWSQLESTNDYRVYVANLRAIGCPEPTVEEIVSGDAGRGFSFERHQLGLDGSGTGKWSRLQEAQTVASLLGRPVPVAETVAQAQGAENQAQADAGTVKGTTVAEASVGSQSAEQSSDVPAGTQNAKQPDRVAAYIPSYPLAFQNVNPEALNLNADQKAAIQQVQQQFVNDIGGPNQNPSDPAYLAKWQTAQSAADDALLALLGRQGYMAYQQQQYYDWYEPQVLAANTAGQPLTINPSLFSVGK